MFDVRSEDQPLFYQVYLNKDRQQSREVIQKADRLGAKAIVFTVDVMCQTKRTLDVRNKRVSKPTPKNAVSTPAPASVSASISGYQDFGLTWSDIDFISVRTIGIIWLCVY